MRVDSNVCPALDAATSSHARDWSTTSIAVGGGDDANGFPRLVASLEGGLFGASRPVEIGRYVIGASIGAGGLGQVFRAFDPRLGRSVAIKLLHPNLRRTRQQRRRLRLEAEALARLTHPNIVEIYDLVGLGPSEDETETHDLEAAAAIVMELVEGPSLSRWLHEPRGWQETVRAFTRAGRGLAAAHGAGIIHRDFKPANVVLGSDGRPRVVDFGLACGAHAAAGATASTAPDRRTRGVRLTPVGTALGTRPYMAPEVLCGEPATAASDQFSFCVSLFEALDGQRPRRNRDTMAVAADVDPSRAAQCGPPWLRRVLAVGLREDPKRRWRSMDALIEQIERGPQPHAGIARRARVALLPALLGVAAVGGPPCAARTVDDDAPPGSSTQHAVLDTMTGDGHESTAPASVPVNLDVARTLRRGGQCRASAPTLPALVSAAPPGLVDDAQLELGLTQLCIGQWNAARSSLFAAHGGAVQTGDDDSAMQAALALSSSFLDDSRELDQADVWLRYAEAAWARLGRPSLYRPRLDQARAATLWASGQTDQARRVLLAAIETSEARWGPDQRQGPLLSDLAMLADGDGDSAAALGYRERALALAEASLGRNHPQTAVAAMELAAMTYDSDEGPAAQAETVLHSLAVLERTLGADHYRVAEANIILAEMAMAEDRDAEATTRLEVAARIHANTLGNDHPATRSTRMRIAEMAAGLDGVEQAHRVLRAARTDGVSDPAVLAELYGGVVRTHLEAGQFDQAGAHAEQALGLAIDAFGSDHAATSEARSAVAEIALARGEFDRAHRQIELALQTTHDDDTPLCSCRAQLILSGAVAELGLRRPKSALDRLGAARASRPSDAELGLEANMLFVEARAQQQLGASRRARRLGVRARKLCSEHPGECGECSAAISQWLRHRAVAEELRHCAPDLPTRADADSNTI